jgi:hypothetical protein
MIQRIGNFVLKEILNKLWFGIGIEPLECGFYEL